MSLDGMLQVLLYGYIHLQVFLIDDRLVLPLFVLEGPYLDSSDSLDILLVL